MPPKAKRRRLAFTPQPLTFSPFARSLALAGRASSKCRHDTPVHGNGFSETDPEDKKKQTDSSDETVMPSDSSDEDDFDGTIQADFAFFDPKPNDFHGVKILLQNYLSDQEWDLSGFVDVILGQTTVGTVVKIEDAEDDGLFSVVTALNLGRYKDCKCIIELKDYLLKVCQEKGVMSDLKGLLQEQAQHTGLLVSQHVMNFPLQLLPPLYDALFDEVLWATEDEPTVELRNSFKFSNYLILGKMWKLKHASVISKLNGSGDGEADVIFNKLEDEIFYRLSSWSFNFPLRSPHVASPELKNYQLMGLVMAVKAEKISEIREELKSLVEES